MHKKTLVINSSVPDVFARFPSLVFTFISGSVCEDTWSTKKCKKIKKKGKCNKAKNQKKCEKTCGACPTTPTTTSIPTTITSSKYDCALPDNANDEYCHDENNNAGCNYDGGACCPGDDPPRLWDAYCSVCECLEGICRFIFIVSMAKEGKNR